MTAYGPIAETEKIMVGGIGGAAGSRPISPATPAPGSSSDSSTANGQAGANNQNEMAKVIESLITSSSERIMNNAMNNAESDEQAASADDGG